MSNIKQEILNVTLANGQVVNAEKITLPDGYCRVVGVTSVGAEEPNTQINIGIKTTQGNDIVEPHSYKFWLQRQGGNYFDSLKPVDFNCGRTVKVELIADGDAPRSNITLQFMFLIEQKE